MHLLSKDYLLLLTKYRLLDKAMGHYYLLKYAMFHRRPLPPTNLVECRPRLEQALAVHLEVGLGEGRKVVALVVLGERGY